LLNREALSDQKYPLKNFTCLKPDAGGKLKEQKLNCTIAPMQLPFYLMIQKYRKLLFTKPFSL
jgi:hypothetical protein